MVVTRRKFLSLIGLGVGTAFTPRDALPAPGSSFLFERIPHRNATKVTDPASGAVTAITDYEWRQNATPVIQGEIPPRIVNLAKARIENAIECLKKSIEQDLSAAVEQSLFTDGSLEIAPKSDEN